MKKILLNEIAQKNAQSFKISGKDFINYLDTSSITENKILNIQKLYINHDIIPSRAKRAVKENTIVYSSVRPNLKHFGIIEKPLENMVVSTGFITLDIIDSTKYNPKYIYYNLSQQKNTDYLDTIARTNVSAYPGINDTDLLNLEILVFDNIEEQIRIANILSSLDDKIELNNRINKELEKLAKTLYDYWFVQFDFPDENKRPYKSSGGKMVYNEVLKREIPTNWEVKHVKDFVDVVTGKEDANFSAPNGKYKFFTCGDDILRCNESAFSGKSILIAGNGNFNVKYFEGQFNAYQRTYVLRPIDPQYVGIIYFSALRMIQAFTRGSSGSIVKFITKGDVEDIPVLIPHDKNLLKTFNRLLDKQNHIQYENDILTEMRDFLLPMLMNGQVTVNS